MTLHSKLPNRCKQCKVRMPADKAHHVIHNECINPWLASEQEKKQRKAEKDKRIAAVKDRRETKAKLEKLKSKAQWAREAQTAFNEWIRLRDADQPCISCGRHHQGQYHAGHYLSVGARPELRFEHLNVHKQCSACNLHLSGNVILYRKGLIGKHGVEIVEWLEGPHPLTHYETDDLIEIKSMYAARTKALKAAQ